MRGDKDRYILLFRIGLASLGLMMLALFVVSCDEVDRHKTLTFFFDGVPPLESEGPQGAYVEPGSQELVQTGQSPAWYVHEPRKDCSNCHSKRKQRSFTPQTHLIAPIPKLCYNCHDDFTATASFVHGPVAVGQCLFCHEPHKSKIEHLLVTPEPGLCYLCHDINTIELIPAHLPKQLSSCTDCHNPHSSSAKGLLKDGSSQTDFEYDRLKILDAASSRDTPIANERNGQINSEQKPAASETQSEGINLSEIFRQINRLIEQGELERAREYLEKFKDNSSFTAEERGQIVRVLTMIDSVINSDKKQPENDKRTNEIKELYYSSMAFYRTGRLIKAREGFVKIINSGLIPESMANTIRSYIADIDNSLARNK